MMRRPPAPRRALPARRHDALVRVEPLEGRRLLAGGAGSDALLRSYGQLPLGFEANVGQTDPRVAFLSRGDGYTLFLAPDEAVLSLRGPAPADAGPATGAAVRMRLVGAAGAAAMAGLDELPG